MGGDRQARNGDADPSELKNTRGEGFVQAALGVAEEDHTGDRAPGAESMTCGVTVQRPGRRPTTATGVSVSMLQELEPLRPEHGERLAVLQDHDVDCVLVGGLVL